MENSIITRSEAKDKGLLRYFTGVPCVRGHVSERYLRGQCIACAIPYSRAIYRRDRDEILNGLRARRAEDPETVRSQEASRRIRNPLPYREASARYKKSNKDLYATHERNRRALKKSSQGTHTHEEIISLFNRQMGKCANCRISIKDGYHADHIIALVNGGRNDIQNIQLLCQPCNQRKRSKDPIVFARQEGRLL